MTTLSAALLDEANLRSRWDRNDSVRKVEAYRRELLADTRSLSELPGGTGIYDQQLVSKAAQGSKGYINCLRLCQLAHDFGQPAVLELGTNLGISSAYLSIGASVAEASTPVATGDASPARLSIAQRMHTTIGLKNLTYYPGYFTETLQQMLTDRPLLGLCFIDGDHTYKGTLEYFQIIREHMKSGGVIIFDDITWSPEMRRVWADISASGPFSAELVVDGVGYLQIAS